MSHWLAADWATRRRRPSAVVAADPTRTRAADTSADLTPYLLDDVVGHHDPWLAHQAEPAKLHGSHHHRARLARSHNVIQQNGGLVDDAGDRVALIEVRMK